MAVETRSGRVLPEFYSLAITGRSQLKTVNKIAVITLSFHQLTKIELGTQCSSTLVDDRSKTPVRVYPLGTSSRTPGVHLRVITR